MKVIALQGRQNSGKTTVLQKVIRKLKNRGYTETPASLTGIPQRDFVGLLKHGSNRYPDVAISTIGDPTVIYENALDWCFNQGVEYVICACREEDGVQTTIWEMRNRLSVNDVDIRYIRTDKIGQADQQIENDAKAESVVRHFFDVVSGTPTLIS